MDYWILVVILVASLPLNIFLILKLLQGNRAMHYKIAGTLLLLIPIIGPLLCWLFYDPPPPQTSYLKNRGARGNYTHHWIGMKPLLDQILKERQEQANQSDEKS